MNKNDKCVQCHREMTQSYGVNKSETCDNDWSLPFCNYPDCPNYGLLQTGILPDFLLEEEKGEL